MTAMVIPATAVSAQDVEGMDPITINGELPATLEGLPEGPEVEGFIAARGGGQLAITGENGANTTVLVAPATEIRSKGGFLGLDKDRLTADSLLNGLPVKVKTVQWGGGLIATRVKLSNKDLETAAMIRNGTAQRFGEHDTAIAENAAATEALRGRFGDIDQYNIKATTDVYFDTAKWAISPEHQTQLCAAAAEAEAIDNALLLVVGYTDSVGSEDYNQVLSEKRAGKVVNHLQQKCGWAPWRMLTPTGMAEADPAADNSTEQGKALNRRVAVNILVSKAVDSIDHPGG
ncbi:OmpA family protein [Sphingomicrobium clamense]|uniref:OmpA family protein n=1 Tax=Sphingomicrobium clamense TaxID=2851013 RepID=A0ABS6V7E8_9SPHN|nr:OmpA family protein [Sphingomicrobium sp. B8]MBW0145489.1 OmpA family protein [Sphingomicrobium sp. B8]